MFRYDDDPSQDKAIQRLKRLRDYREHDLVAALAEKYVGRWPDGHVIMKFYGQSLIENGDVLAASGFLESALK